jgi:predicted enzyme related to lactoylglutathione lyase
MGRHFPQAVINTIEVTSLEDTIKKIEAASGQKIHGPTEVLGVGLHAYCANPEGNLFGVMQPQEASSE